MLMIYIWLLVLGLCLGSFVNALVWRLHQQEAGPKQAKISAKRTRELSLARGRSMCPRCGHKLSGKDLVPLLSWAALRGKCRYCHRPISIQYPLVELLTAGLFLFSYLAWPHPFTVLQYLAFTLWLGLLTGLIALTVYDLRWYILPDRLTYPLMATALIFALLQIAGSGMWAKGLLNLLFAVLAGGGIFYLVFQLSAGKWIGGGDVKLGVVLGLIVGSPVLSLLFIFVASVLGSLVALPLLAMKRLRRSSVIPFGPFLIVGACFSLFWGERTLNWYLQAVLNIR